MGPDIHVKVGKKTLYSVPWRLIGEHVDARETPTTVKMFHDGVLVKTHITKPWGRQTDNNDYPPEKIAFEHRARGGAASATPPEVSWFPPSPAV